MAKTHAHRQPQADAKTPTHVQAQRQAAAVRHKPHKAAAAHHVQALNMCVHKVSRATADHRQQVVQDQVRPTLVAANQVRAEAAQATTEAVHLHHQEVHRQALAAAVHQADVQVVDSLAEAIQAAEVTQAAAAVQVAAVEEDNSPTSLT